MIDPLITFGSQPAGVVSTVLSLTISVLGLVVGVIAFRGYQRNQSLPMLFVAVGFLLTFWTPILLFGSQVTLGAFGQFAPGMRETVAVAFSLAGGVSQIVGLCCILYGLRMPLRR